MEGSFFLCCPTLKRDNFIQYFLKQTQRPKTHFEYYRYFELLPVGNYQRTHLMRVNQKDGKICSPFFNAEYFRRLSSGRPHRMTALHCIVHLSFFFFLLSSFSIYLVRLSSLKYRLSALLQAHHCQTLRAK